MMYLFGAPVLLALVIYYMKASRKLRSLLTRLNIRITDPSPTAFDHFFQEGLSCYIVFHLKSKETLGATFHKNSFATAYPDTQQIYVEQLWVIDPVTRHFIQPMTNTKGAIIKLDDCDYIEMFTTQPT